MSRDQRIKDNWALLYAQNLALEKKQLLLIVFNIVPIFLDATVRQYDFMIKGLIELEKECREKNIPFLVLQGKPEKTIPQFVKETQAGAVFTDFSPLKIGRNWRERISKNIGVSMIEVDAHNIIPCWVTSNKQEYSARTIRPKIKKLLMNYLTGFPPLKKMPDSVKNKKYIKNYDWEKTHKFLAVNKSVPLVAEFEPGTKAGYKKFNKYLSKKIRKYGEYKNDPNKNYLSDLSPYLHFGQISAQKVAYDIIKKRINKESKETFLEELIVRRELAENFCCYNKEYGNTNGFPDWAKQTLKEHLNDPRKYIYTSKELEDAKTHDDLWNAAQMQMVETGKMHGYMRMYWAKKILEWTRTTRRAMEIAVYLNDKYSFDGRDPNGYTGIAWSIGGVHDRPWPQRPIFGKIRYMSYSGCEKKFNVGNYIKKFIRK